MDGVFLGGVFFCSKGIVLDVWFLAGVLFWMFGFSLSSQRAKGAKGDVFWMVFFLLEYVIFFLDLVDFMFCNSLFRINSLWALCGFLLYFLCGFGCF